MELRSAALIIVSISNFGMIDQQAVPQSVDSIPSLLLRMDEALVVGQSIMIWQFLDDLSCFPSSRGNR